ncbi:MAG: transcription antitermination factor NusB [Omnitrophica WOR_2 bacterium RIFCSPHIGHO2_01_FULL_48_9]|nr:MAG: transcription antitermination factor NusB [Omnitrophica WOR_2 bacterium RIFCSPHIGHO2_02_FULL_48_11]OGX30826.1 MAG: transcription antitermination factor NusB [Omnitrophica WOR_2 bacterium RIFCSPHIGHO2_01_FULL_48_9]
MRRRTQARDCALKILYQADITKRDVVLVSEGFWNAEESVDKEVREFSHRLVVGVGKHMNAIDEMISKYATNWQLKRMAIIDRNVLRLGAFELLFAPDIPPKVTINEAVELAKKYGDLESSKFVNGILDKIHKVEVVPQGLKT